MGGWCDEMQRYFTFSIVVWYMPRKVKRETHCDCERETHRPPPSPRARRTDSVMAVGRTRHEY